MRTLAWLLFSLLLQLTVVQTHAQIPRVFVFTDINIDAGDPDDRQSLVHLFWYADEVKIEGVFAERSNAGGLEACQLALEAYSKDYKPFGFARKGFPTPKSLESVITSDYATAESLFRTAASNDESILYLLVWGNMQNVAKLLSENPGLAENVRLLTIGTDLLLERDRPHLPESWEKVEPCKQPNWNGKGRNALFEDKRFNSIWWLEMNWTYAGMFIEPGPSEIYKKFPAYGALGQHMKDVTRNQQWAKYFRVGDTPTVLYLIDPSNDVDDPTKGSWAGRFRKPFPDQRPNYYADDCGDIEWNYHNPCETWGNHEAVAAFSKSTLHEQRPDMYDALLKKLHQLYRKSN
ncbi:MAG: nucleoside hydrolase-like domain-containing protein [Puniceicoccaceae bacterium]